MDSLIAQPGAVPNGLDFAVYAASYQIVAKIGITKTYDISKIRTVFRKIGTPTGALYPIIYARNISTDVPSTVLGTGDEVQKEDMPSSAAWTNFNFSTAARVQMGDTIYVGYYSPATAMNGADYLRWYGNVSTTRRVLKADATPTWSAHTAATMSLELWGTLAPAQEATDQHGYKKTQGYKKWGGFR